eukprot:750635-Hanusia_phi.AAC.2
MQSARKGQEIQDTGGVKERQGASTRAETARTTTWYLESCPMGTGNSNFSSSQSSLPSSNVDLPARSPQTPAG